MRKNISDVLYSYNKTKLEDLLDMEEFSTIFQYFLSQPNILHQVTKPG